MKKTLLTIFGLTAMASSAMLGQTLITWDLTGEAGNQTSTAGATSGPDAAFITSPLIARGPGLTGVTANNSLNTSAWNTLNPSQDYIAFTFTTGAIIPPTATDFDTLTINVRASNTGPGPMAIRWSGDSFVANIYTFAAPTTAATFSVDISALTLAASTSYEFRIITTATTLTGTSANSGNILSGGTFRVNSAELAVIPEPATWALLGLGAMAVIIRRKIGALKF